MSSSIVTLVGDNLTEQYGRRKWYGSVASNGCVYGVPWDASRVVEWNATEKSSTAIGNDLNGTWWEGVEVNGKIYCMPKTSDGKVLKIDARTKKVETLDTPFPESDFNEPGWSGIGWKYGALGNDGKLYFCPAYAKRMLRLDPSDDSMTSVAKDFGRGEWKFEGTVKAMDGSLVGIPHNYKQVVKYDTNESADSTTMIGDEAEKNFKCRGNGAMDANGIIYAVNTDGNIVRIDTSRNTHEIIQVPQSTTGGWYGAYKGMDGNIYFPPLNASRVLKLNVTTQRPSLVGGEIQGGNDKYYGGALDPESGFIYCFPFDADRILAIDTNVQDLSHQNANGGIHDSPHGDPDRLGYRVYAEGLSNVAQKVESPDSSLCVGLYAPWGGGKTFLYELIEEELQQRAKQEEERLGKELDGGEENDKNKEPGIHKHAMNQSLWTLCKFALFIDKVLCCRCFSTGRGFLTDSDDLRPEIIAAIMAIIIFWPLWIAVFLLLYSTFLCITSARLISRWIRNRCGYGEDQEASESKQELDDAGTVENSSNEVGGSEWSSDIEQGTGEGNERESFLSNNGKSQKDGATNDSSLWDKVWKILTGQTSLHATMPFSERGCRGKFRLWILRSFAA